MKWLIDLYVNAFSGFSKNVWILALTMFINRSGSMVLTFLSLYMTIDLGYSNSKAGYALGVYGVGSILGSYVGGWLADRRSHFDIMVWSLILSGILMFPLMYVTSYWGIISLVFLISFTADIFRPANTIAVAMFSKKENQTRSFSLIRLAVNLGFSIGPAAGGFIAAYLGYKWLFFLDGLTCGLAALVLIVFLPKKATDAKQKEVLNVVDEKPDEKNLSAYKDYQFLGFVFFVALYATIFFQLFTSVPVYFNKILHYSEEKIGLFLALNGILIVLLELPIVAKLETYKKFMKIISFGALLLPISFIFLLMGPSSIIFAIIYTFFISMSEVLAMPFMMNYAVSRPHKSRQGQYLALYAIAYGAALILAPILGLRLADTLGFETTYKIFIGVSVLVVFAFYSMRNKANVD